MATVKEVYKTLDSWAPFETQMSFDNAGLLVGHENREVTSVLVALDVTQSVVEEAAALGCNLIVAHHPVIFEPVRTLTDSNPTGRVLLTMVEQGIAAICAHTNLDAAQGGVNCALARKLELTEIGQLHPDGVDEQGREYGIGRVGMAHTSGLSVQEYAAFVKEKLNTSSVRFVDTGKPVTKVAVGGGSCADGMLEALDAGCDTFVTADVKYNQFWDARDLSMTIIDAGHFYTENPVVKVLADKLTAAFPEIKVMISATHTDCAKFF